MSRKDEVLKNFIEQEQFTNRRVESEINRNRKGTFKLNITKDGKSLSDAKVTAVQKTHEFKYGANLFMLDELETPEKNSLYKKYFADAFNMATLPFYWDATEPEEGKTRYSKDSERIYRRPPIDLCMEFCKANGIEPREHGLAYDNFFPKWLYNANVSDIKKALTKRFKEISERYADKIPTIEVTNETFWNTSKTAFYRENDFVEWSFKEAEKYFGANKLSINEAHLTSWADKNMNRSKYYMQIERALLKGARIDAIGLQFHMFFGSQDEVERTKDCYYNPSYLFQYMDKMAEFNLPIQITEITIPAYSNSEEDEALQAELIERLYSIWFSHEKVEQIIYWNLVDGYCHVNDVKDIASTQGNMTVGENYYYGGLIRFDMTPKPAYYTVKNLFEKKWHTEETFLTDSDGNATLNGFFGTYNITVEVDGKVYEREVNLFKCSKRNIDIIL